MLKNRLIALGLFAASVAGISLVGGPVSYGFFFFSLTIPVISLIYTLVLLFRFKIYQELDTRSIVAETPVQFYFTLQNEDLFAHAGIRTDFFSDFSSISGLDSRTVYELFPGTGVSNRTTLVCRYRGEYEIGVRTVTVMDYLRLFSVTFRNRETLRVTVMPRFEILESVSCLEELAASPRDSRAAATEPDVPVREYLPGDDPRTIHWKATARTGKPMVRTRIGEESPGLFILMDSCRYSERQEEYLPLENKLLETTLSLVYYYLARGIRTGVYVFGTDPVRYALEGTGSYEGFYAAMSSFRFRAESTQEKLFIAAGAEPAIYEGGAVILVLHEWTGEAAVFAERLGECAISVLVCLVTDGEERIPETEGAARADFLTIGYDGKLGEMFG
ncbi:MAG: DUF58 domain-containing protein [Lachnospiraceae bacterium]|nr:DUF58 domain-containing protein [Lachnospiraceae bacterium]